MRAEFIQSCSSDTQLQRHYANNDRGWQKAGREIKKAIADCDKELPVGYYPFSVKNLNSHFFTVERMNYEGQLYAIVTNSAINYIFAIYP